MQKGQLNIEKGVLYYEKRKDKVFITGFSGSYFKNRDVWELVLPSLIEEQPVCGIGRKAFLGQKQVRRIVLPEGVEEVEDWAFAHCANLESIVFPGREISFGKAVFKDCGGLKKVEIRQKTQDADQDAAVLLAAAVVEMGADKLLDPQNAGKREWLENWDTELLKRLMTSEEEGYQEQEVCGEEDYGGLALEEYCSEKRKEKVRLAYMRLLHSKGLSEAVRMQLEQFLRSVTKGQAGEEAWQVLLHEHGEEGEYYRLFAEIGCITEENFSEILAEIGENYPEMKACFMRKEEGRHDSEDFFRELAL